MVMIVVLYMMGYSGLLLKSCRRIGGNDGGNDYGNHDVVVMVW